MLTGAQKLARFEKALHLAGDTHTVADVLEKVRVHRAQYWEEGDTSVVTEVLTYPRLKAVNYWLVAGNLHDCFALQDQINAWAIENGCSIALATGRRGWLKVCDRFGWKLRAVQFAKPLGGAP